MKKEQTSNEAPSWVLSQLEDLNAEVSELQSLFGLMEQLADYLPDKLPPTKAELEQ